MILQHHLQVQTFPSTSPVSTKYPSTSPASTKYPSTSHPSTKLHFNITCKYKNFPSTSPASTTFPCYITCMYKVPFNITSKYKLSFNITCKYKINLQHHLQIQNYPSTFNVSTEWPFNIFWHPKISLQHHLQVQNYHINISCMRKTTIQPCHTVQNFKTTSKYVLTVQNKYSILTLQNFLQKQDNLQHFLTVKNISFISPPSMYNIT